MILPQLLSPVPKVSKKKAEKKATMPETADYSLSRNPALLEAPLGLLWTCPHCGQNHPNRDGVQCGCSDQLVLCFHKSISINRFGYVIKGTVISDEELGPYIKKLEGLPRFPNSDGSLA